MTTAILATSQGRLSRSALRRTGSKTRAAGSPLSISVVTPILNGGEFFRQTYLSVIGQNREIPLEWIIVDGGSRDGTLPLLRSIRDSRVKWISESDAGQAAAINKGLAMASGDIVAWLNCDDLYLPGMLTAVALALADNPTARWLIGRCNMIDSAGNSVRHGITTYKDRLLHSYSLKSLLRINMISQPAVFWRRPFGQEVGPLDENLYYTMDYDLWLRMALPAADSGPDAGQVPRSRRQQIAGRLPRSSTRAIASPAGTWAAMPSAGWFIGSTWRKLSGVTR